MLEKEAYEVERKALKALGKDSVVAADFFPSNYKTLLELLKNSEFPPKMYDFLLYELNILAHINNMGNRKNSVKFLNTWIDMKSHKDIKFTDKIWWTIQVHNIINKNREQTIE